MVNIFCDTITEELIVVAMQISRTQRVAVRLVAPTDTVEVRNYEEVSEVQDSKSVEESTDDGKKRIESGLEGC